MFLIFKKVKHFPFYYKLKVKYFVLECERLCLTVCSLSLCGHTGQDKCHAHMNFYP